MRLRGIVRRLIEEGRSAHSLALAAVEPEMAHATAAGSSFLRGPADAGRPADLDLARPQLVAVGTDFGPMFEQRDHDSWCARAGCVSHGRGGSR